MTKPALPARLAKFAANEAAAVNGRYCWGLPGYDAADKVRVNIVKKLGASDLLDDVDAPDEADAGWTPLATLGTGRGSDEFLVVSTTAPHAVGLWQHETGKVARVWESLEAFLAGLLDKRDKTPMALLEGEATKANKMLRGGKARQCIALLEPRLATVPAYLDSESESLVSYAWQVLAEAHVAEGAYEAAARAYERACALDSDSAPLALASLLLHELAAPARVVDWATPLLDQKKNGTNKVLWATRYLAEAHLRLGNEKEAEAVLRAAQEKYGRVEAELMKEVSEDFALFAASKLPGAEQATRFLAWFKAEAIDPEEAARNRAWFDALPEPVQQALRPNGGVPSDSELVKAKETRSLWVQAGMVHDVTVFLSFPKLERLIFSGAPASLEPLRAHPRLARVRFNGEDVADFR